MATSGNKDDQGSSLVYLSTEEWTFAIPVIKSLGFTSEVFKHFFLPTNLFPMKTYQGRCKTDAYEMTLGRGSEYPRPQLSLPLGLCSVTADLVDCIRSVLFKVWSQGQQHWHCLGTVRNSNSSRPSESKIWCVAQSCFFGCVFFTSLLGDSDSCLSWRSTTLLQGSCPKYIWTGLSQFPKPPQGGSWFDWSGWDPDMVGS